MCIRDILINLKEMRKEDQERSFIFYKQMGDLYDIELLLNLRIKIATVTWTSNTTSFIEVFTKKCLYSILFQVLYF